MKEEQSGFEPILDEAEDPAIEFFNLSNKLNQYATDLCLEGCE